MEVHRKQCKKYGEKEKSSKSGIELVKLAVRQQITQVTIHPALVTHDQQLGLVPIFEVIRCRPDRSTEVVTSMTSLHVAPDNQPKEMSEAHPFRQGSLAFEGKTA